MIDSRHSWRSSRQRGDLLERRRTLMDAWARFATTASRANQASNVTPIRQARSRRQGKTAR